MMSTTSSAESEADRARNCVAFPAAATPSITARPPPSGRCTSSSTTSGSVATMPAMACATVPASPQIHTRSAISLRMPARNSVWSSTRYTFVRVRMGSGSQVVGRSGGWALRRLRAPRLVGGRATALQPQHHLRADARDAAHIGGAAVAAHAPDDGVAQPPAVGVNSGRLEADAPVPDEHLRADRVHLRVDVDGVDARVASRVDQQRQEPLIEVV